MKLIFTVFFFCITIATNAQLGFCSGSKGDPIFHEDFGEGQGTGNELSPGITDYTFVRQDPEDGEYTISSTIGQRINSWHSTLPNTNISGGRALIVNADFNAGRFYRKKISGLCENTTYEFSAYLMNIYNRASNICENGGIPNNVRFEIWDETDTTLLKSGDTPDINSTNTPQWEQFALTFKSEPGQGSVILKMFNNGEGGCGNDLAIDDIIFRSCGDLVTLSTPGDSGEAFSICEENAPIRVNLEAVPDGSVFVQQFYQWQISLNDEDWGNIPGANSSTYETSLIDDSVFFRVKVAEDENNLGGNFCSVVSNSFQVKIIETPEAPISEGDITVCQNEPGPALRVTVEEGEIVNWYDEETGGTLLAENTSTYYPIAGGVYYAEAIRPDNECSSSERTAVRLTVNRLPTLQDEELKICTDSSLQLETGVTGYTFRWSTGETTDAILVTSPGDYQVDVISAAGCFTTKEFFVSSIENAEIQEVVSKETYIEIIPTMEGDFFYSLDGFSYQNSPVFNGLDGGVYTAFITDSINCNVDSLEFAHIVVPRMITPNNDGFNDNFELKGVEFFDESEITIFDRYGKLLATGKGAGFKWNGRLQGKDLPADDYWFKISISGFPVKTGHFSLVR